MMEHYIIVGLLILVLAIELYKLIAKEDIVDPTAEVISSMKVENNDTKTNIVREFADTRTILNKDLSDTRAKLSKSINEGLRDNLKELTEFKEDLNLNINRNFENMNGRIENQMERINKRVELRLDEGFEKTNKTFTNIVERLTKIDEAQKNIDKLSTEVVSLQHLLSDKKTRGTFGEVQLKHILSAIFGDNNTKVYDTQVTLSNDKIVDALIYLPEEMGNLAVDSKFPLENYHKLVDRKLSERERELANRAFKQDMKRHIDEISTKYIIPVETSDQAVLFVPAEAVFAEINAYHQDVVDYSNKKRVWIASPTTLMSLLTTVQVLLRNAERDKYSKIIQDELMRLGAEFSRYQERWDKLSKNIDTVSKSVKDIHTTSTKIGKRFTEISQVNLDKKEITSPE
jgi:DNA recombination protein RmuC